MLKVFQAYKKRPSIVLRNQLVVMNMGLARQIAHSVAKTSKEPYEDLEQIAMLGLIAAVERYDPDTGLRFSTYAYPTINGKVLQYLRDRGAAIRIPQSLQDLYIKKVKAEAILRNKLNRTPTEAEVTEFLGIENKQLTEAISAWDSKVLASLSVPVGCETDTPILLEDTIISPEYSVPEIVEVPKVPFKDLSKETTCILQQVFLEDGTCKAAAVNRGITAATVKRKLRKAVEEFATAC